MTANPFPANTYSDDVTIIRQDDKTILLVGTAHVSQQSVDLVKQIIEQEKPDTVCIELDEKRYESLAKRQRWENLDLKEVIKKKQLATLLVNLILSSYQKKLGGQLMIVWAGGSLFKLGGKYIVDEVGRNPCGVGPRIKTGSILRLMGKGTIDFRRGAQFNKQLVFRTELGERNLLSFSTGILKHGLACYHDDKLGLKCPPV